MKMQMMLLAAATISIGQMANAMEMPPRDYEGQWWTNALGCTYSRTGRPGEVSWTLHRHTMKRGCPNYFVQVAQGS